MPDDIFPNENDAVLLPYLSAESEAVSEECLNRLFEENVIPQIRKVLTSYLTLGRTHHFLEKLILKQSASFIG